MSIRYGAHDPSARCAGTSPSLREGEEDKSAFHYDPVSRKWWERA